jgi:hypothetical protein
MQIPEKSKRKNKKMTKDEPLRGMMKDEMENTPVRLAVCNNHRRCLPTHGGCEAVAAERARLRPTGYAVASWGK